MSFDVVPTQRENETAVETESRATAVASPEFAVTGQAHPGEALGEVFRRVAEELAAREAEILSVMVFGAVGSRDDIDREMRDALGEPMWPITWVEGASCDGGPLAGVQAMAVSRRPVTRVRLGGKIVGSVYEDGGARYCLLGGIGPTATSLREPAQVQQMFGNLESALDLAGFELRDVIRTWFYNRDILRWYDEFNRVRSAHYAQVNFRTGSIPASTGVAGRNPADAALAVAAWAMRPIDPQARAFEVGSPLQCPAPKYGSSFARAMEINSGGSRRLLISGTASIHPNGATAWVGNAKKQVDLSMEVIGAILQSRGMTFTDVTRATAYFKHPMFKPYFEAWCASQELRRFPVVAMHCDICRDDLLFELELDACVPAT